MVSALIIAVGLVIFGLRMRPDTGISPVGGPHGSESSVSSGDDVPGTSPAASAPIVALTILSPVEHEVLNTKDVTVIGLAPPGLTVTRDVSFGLDQHATADGTGHWAMTVGLEEGDHELVFRIGDDRSTEKKIRVMYTPPAP